MLTSMAVDMNYTCRVYCYYGIVMIEDLTALFLVSVRTYSSGIYVCTQCL